MALAFTYVWVWKGVAIDGSLFQDYYWVDFNPTNNPRPSGWNTCTAESETSNFSLSWFQPWHEVWCAVFNLKNNGSSTATSNVTGIFQRYDGSWSTSWTFQFDHLSLNAWEEQAWYIYFGVDDDEVRPWYSKYRVIFDCSDDSITSNEFTVSWLSIDSSRHSSWHLWVEGEHLCYIDGTRWTTWYKHSIAYDGNYSEYISTDKKWFIWLEENDYLSIYYITDTGRKRRTYGSDARYGWNVNVWTSKRWFMRVPTWWAEDWYWHLCYVWPNWSKRRVLNWPPTWHT